MILTCPHCETQYFADDSTIGESGRTVKCAACGGSWFVEPKHLGDTVKRIDGTEVPLKAPWRDFSHSKGDADPDPDGPVLAGDHPVDETGADKRAAPVEGEGHPETFEPAEEATPGSKPQLMDQPRDGGADDLKKIKGIGPKLEELCHSLGIFHYDQIASWTDEEVAWVDSNLEGFKGRVSRDEWVPQARELSGKS